MSTYPLNVIGGQFHFDTDGTYGQVLSSSRVQTSVLTPTQLKNFSDWSLIGSTGYSESIPQSSSRTIYINFLFPELRDINNYSMNWTHTTYINSTTGLLRYSSDTTTGLDGTWTTFDDNTAVQGWKNTNQSGLWTPSTVNLTGVKGIELQMYFATGPTVTTSYIYFYCLNVFGAYTPTGLEFWHATNDLPMNGNNFNFGDTSRGGIYPVTFRVKNHSATLTANDVIVTAQTPSIGDLQSGITFSDGGAYSSSITIPSIAPGAISPVITARRTVAGGAPQNSLNTTRITATETSWT